MTTFTAMRDAKRAPVHPGELLREDVLPALNMPVATAARHLGVSRQTLHRILAGKMPVTPAMALRLGKFCGNGPTLWLNMQGAYDLWHAAQAMRKALGKILPSERRDQDWHGKAASKVLGWSGAQFERRLSSDAARR